MSLKPKDQAENALGDTWGPFLSEFSVHSHSSLYILLPPFGEKA